MIFNLSGTDNLEGFLLKDVRRFCNDFNVEPDMEGGVDNGHAISGAITYTIGYAGGNKISLMHVKDMDTYTLYFYDKFLNSVSCSVDYSRADIKSLVEEFRFTAHKIELRNFGSRVGALMQRSEEDRSNTSIALRVKELRSLVDGEEPAESPDWVQEILKKDLH